MSVRVRIKGRTYLLSWSEFEKALANHTVTEAIDILAIVGGAHDAV
jgi:hypothetical protein